MTVNPGTSINSLGVCVDPLAYDCTRCGRTAGPAHIQRYTDTDTDCRICDDCHRQDDPRAAAVGDALEVIVLAAGGGTAYDEAVYDVVTGLLSRVRATASERHLDRVAESVLGITPQPKKVVDLGHELLDGDGQFVVCAELRNGRPWITLGDSVFPIWADEAYAAREVVQQIGDMIEIAEMAARFGGEA